MSTWGRPGSRQQRALRVSVLRAWPTCYVCHAAPSVQDDHVIPLAEGGSDDRSNHRGICLDCHRAKSADEARRGAERARKRLLRQPEPSPGGWPGEDP